MKVRSTDLRKVIEALIDNKGRFFTIICKRRMDERDGVHKLRIFHLKFDVTKYRKGGEAAYNFDKKNLLCAADTNTGGFRAVNCNDIALVVVNKRVVLNDLASYKNCDLYEEAMALYNRIEDKTPVLAL